MILLLKACSKEQAFLFATNIYLIEMSITYKTPKSKNQQNNDQYYCTKGTGNKKHKQHTDRNEKGDQSYQLFKGIPHIRSLIGILSIIYAFYRRICDYASVSGKAISTASSSEISLLLFFSVNLSTRSGSISKSFVIVS